MTYWTAPAASRPATRMAAAIAATPVAFAKTLALCVSLTAVGALVVGAPDSTPHNDDSHDSQPLQK